MELIWPSGTVLTKLPSIHKGINGYKYHIKCEQIWIEFLLVIIHSVPLVIKLVDEYKAGFESRYVEYPTPL
ncbi:hypothetical protein BpHYR1_051056, partial [Brachionus plicatilis]